MSNQLQPLGGLMGVNLLKDPSAISDDEVAWAQNVVPTKSGMLSTRMGTQVIETNAGFQPGGPMMTFARPTFKGAAEFILTARQFSPTANSNTLVAVADLAGTVIKSVLSTPTQRQPIMVHFQ